ncbi:MAG: hypothetical protein K9M60_01985 [Akkermansiaceae bacterium]|nr:hypothetical protein [Akkermansiaceae bacterium]
MTMIKNSRFCAITAVLLTATALTSCYYDPYFTSVSATYGGSYSSSSRHYGGGSGYSSSVYISTGNPEWGYDPYTYSYYNYRRRCYYDPYLNGFYPVGYRPPVFAGCVHPHGWRPGASYCPPPRRVSNITIVNYRNRESSYRRSGYIHHGHQHHQDRGSRYTRDYDQQYRSRSHSRDYRQERRTGPSAFNTPENHTAQQTLESSNPVQTRVSSPPQITEPATSMTVAETSPTNTNIESAAPSIQAPPSPSESSSAQVQDSAPTASAYTAELSNGSTE